MLKLLLMVAHTCVIGSCHVDHKDDVNLDDNAEWAIMACIAPKTLNPSENCALVEARGSFASTTNSLLVACAAL